MLIPVLSIGGESGTRSGASQPLGALHAAHPLTSVTWAQLGPTPSNDGAWGPQAGKLAVVAVDWRSPNLIYAAGGPWLPSDNVDVSASGIWVTHTSGKAWQRSDLGLPDSRVISIWIDPDRPAIALAVTLGGIARTSNGGMSWTAVGSNVPGAFSRLVSVGTTLYVAALDGVYSSQDLGLTWTRSLAADLSWGMASGAMASNTTTTCLAATLPSHSSLVTCVDPAGTWKSLKSPCSRCDIESVWLGSSGSHEIVVEPFGGRFGGGMAASWNWGSTWSEIRPPHGGFQAFAIDPRSSNVFWGAASDGALSRTVDSGRTWLSEPTEGDIRTILLPPDSSRFLYLGTDQGLFLVSLSKKIVTAAGLGVDTGMMYSVASAGNNIATVAQDYSPPLSSDSGHSWTLSNYGSELGAAYANPADPGFLYVATDTPGYPGTFLVATNGPNSLDPLSSSVPEFSSLAIAPSSPNDLYGYVGGSIWMSTTWGIFWRRAEWTPKRITLDSLVVDPNNSRHLFAVDVNQNLIATTHDGGSIWSTRRACGAGKVSTNIAWSQGNPRFVAYGVTMSTNAPPFSTVEGLCESTDGGVSFHYSQLGSRSRGSAVGVLSYVPGDPNGAIYIGDDAGVYFSSSFGTPVASVTSNLLGPPEIQAMSWIHGHLLLATYGQGIQESRQVLDDVGSPSAATCEPLRKSGHSLTVRWRARSGHPRGYVVVVSYAGRKPYHASTWPSSSFASLPKWVAAGAAESATFMLRTGYEYRATVIVVGSTGADNRCVTQAASL